MSKGSQRTTSCTHITVRTDIRVKKELGVKTVRLGALDRRSREAYKWLCDSQVDLMRGRQKLLRSMTGFH